MVGISACVKTFSQCRNAVGDFEPKFKVIIIMNLSMKTARINFS
jgi:hypothetical protein